MSAKNAAANAFRKLAHARHSCRRFQPNSPIPNNVLQDMLETTLVRNEFQREWKLFYKELSEIKDCFIYLDSRLPCLANACNLIYPVM